MQRLTGMDATFLYTETPAAHMHVTGVSIFDPTTVPEGYDFEKVKELVRNRLQLLPPFRRRLAEIPFGLHHPLWIEDPDFDLDYHIRRAALPAPGGDKELAEFAAEVNSRPLDRTRPLWEMYVIEGLENGLIATVTKTHHAAIDGVSGAELTVNLLDLQPEPMVLPEQDPPWQPDKVPTDMELVGYALASLARQPLAAIKAARRTAEMAVTLRRRNRQPGITPPPSPFSAPKTSINVSISPHRRVAFTEVSLDDVKMVKNALSGTVNDVVLALCSGALRRYFEDRNEDIDEPLVAMVPISVRTEDQKGTMGNRVSSMFVNLASDIDDPVKRLHAIHEGTKDAKEQEKAFSAETLTDWTEFAAPAVAARAFRLLSSTRILDRTRPIFNVTISNVPGPNFPLYSAGARMVAMYPLGPILDGGALNITCMSYMGSMFFGLNADREAVPDVDAIAAHINDALAELVKVASSGSGSGAKSTPKKKAAAAAKAKA
jgi:WS/DGAT/MGAT family acyltransferase